MPRSPQFGDLTIIILAAGYNRPARAGSSDEHQAMKMKFYATVPKGLSEALAEELRVLGAQDLRVRSAGVGFSGSLETAYRVCLWSRCASRVLMPLAQWPAGNPESLYEAACQFDWNEHMSLESTFAIDCTSQRAAINHTQYAALKVKDAIVDTFREKFDDRPSVDTEQPDIRFHVHLQGRQAELSLDLAGESLHRRSYRGRGHAAPIKENLAAGLLYMAGWPALAKQKAGLLDPMCGTGTLLIEAASMAADIAPGLARDRFGFHGWKQHDDESWQKLLSEARERKQQGIKNKIPVTGYDSDKQAVEQARIAAKTAGLASWITVEHAELDKLAEHELLPGTETGLLITNPPYGERLGDQDELQQLYRQLAELIRARFPGWHAAMITSNEKLASFVSLPLDHRHIVFNGAIESQLYVYKPVSTLLDDDASAGFANRLRKNLKHLSKMARRLNTDCYRVYDADLPEYAAAIDVYECDGHRKVHIQEYAPPKTIDPEKAFVRLQQLVAHTADVLEVSVSDIYLKVRQKQKGKRQYNSQKSDSKNDKVNEQGCLFWVNFTDYLDTGLFLDHRITRNRIRELSRDKDFLNLYAYTCTASVYAAAGGASSTTSVDMSSTYLAWGERNMRLNSLDTEKNSFVRADCLQWLREQAENPAKKYGLIFIDPPTFSNSKRNEEDFDVQRDYVELIRLAGKLLTKNGLLIFSNNFRRFKMDETKLKGFEIKDISASTIPEDFKRNPRIHKCWEVRHKNSVA